MSTVYGVAGDSQAQGLLLDGALPRLLGEALVSRHPHPGWSTRRLRDEGMIGAALRELARAPATRRVLLVVAGGNDTPPTTATAQARYRELLLAVADDARNAGVELVWIGPVFARVSPDAAQHPLVANAQRAAFDGSSVRWIDAQPLTRDLARDDNVHLATADYGVFAERVKGQLEGSGGGGLLLLSVLGLGAWVLFSRQRTLGAATAAFLIPGIPPL